MEAGALLRSSVTFQLEIMAAFVAASRRCNLGALPSPRTSSSGEVMSSMLSWHAGGTYQTATRIVPWGDIKAVWNSPRSVRVPENIMLNALQHPPGWRDVIDWFNEIKWRIIAVDWAPASKGAGTPRNKEPVGLQTQFSFFLKDGKPAIPAFLRYYELEIVVRICQLERTVPASTRVFLRTPLQ